MSADVIIKQVKQENYGGTSLVDLMDMFLEMPLQDPEIAGSLQRPQQSAKGATLHQRARLSQSEEITVKKEMEPEEPKRVLPASSWIKEEPEEIKVFVEHNYFEDDEDRFEDHFGDNHSEGEEPVLEEMPVKEEPPEPPKAKKPPKRASMSEKKPKARKRSKPEEVAEEKPSPLEADLRSSEALICFFCQRAFLSCDQRFRHEKEIHLTTLPMGDPKTEVEVKFRSREFKRFYDQRNESLEKVCCFCGSAFEDSFGRFEHEVLTHLATLVEATEFPEVEYRRFECHVCSQREENLADIQRHLKKAHFPDFVLFSEKCMNRLFGKRDRVLSVVCFFCQETFDSCEARKTHENYIHFNRLKNVRNEGHLYRCRFCTFTESDIRKMQEHVPKHENQETTGKIVIADLSQEELVSEMLDSVERLGKNCKYCNKTFADRFKRRFHERKAHFSGKQHLPHYASFRYRKYHCNMCSYAVHKFASLVVHFRKIHDTEKKESVVIQKHLYSQTEAFVAGEEEKQEILKIIRAGSRKCDFCPASFSDKSRCLLHLIKHHFDVGWRCLVCQQLFHPKFQLEKHLQEEHKVNETQLQPERAGPDSEVLCSACGKGFKSHRLARMHESRVHNKECSFKCPHCDLGLGNGSDLNRHIRIKHKNLIFKCHQCFAVLYTSEAYFAHKCDGGYEKKICTKCNFLFQSEGKLRAHEKLCGFELVCEEPGCGAVFKKRKKLNAHYERHKWQKGLIEKKRCELCGNRFFDNFHLNKHLKGVHKHVPSPD